MRSAFSTRWSASACSCRSSRGCTCGVRGRSMRWRRSRGASSPRWRSSSATATRSIGLFTPAMCGLAAAAAAFALVSIAHFSTESRVTQGLFDLTGKTAAVIGAGSGIGEAVALGCAAQGARVDLSRRERGRGAAGRREGHGRRPSLRGRDHRHLRRRRRRAGLHRARREVRRRHRGLHARPSTCGSRS